MTLSNPDEGAPDLSQLGIGDIDTMQAMSSIRVPDTSMMPSLACIRSAAFPRPSISTGKERDTESGNDDFGARYYASSMGGNGIGTQSPHQTFFPVRAVRSPRKAHESVMATKPPGIRSSHANPIPLPHSVPSSFTIQIPLCKTCSRVIFVAAAIAYRVPLTEVITCGVSDQGQQKGKCRERMPISIPQNFFSKFAVYFAEKRTIKS